MLSRKIHKTVTLYSAVYEASDEKIYVENSWENLIQVGKFIQFRLVVVFERWFEKDASFKKIFKQFVDFV